MMNTVFIHHHQVLKRATDPAHGHQFYFNPAIDTYIYQDYEDQSVMNDIREKLKYIVKDHARRLKLKTFTQKEPTLCSQQCSSPTSAV